MPSFEALLRARLRAVADAAKLTAREREVLDLLFLGRTHDDIALALGITPRTAKFHARNIIHKLGADSRLDLVRVLLLGHG